MDWQDIGKVLILRDVPLIGGLLTGLADASAGIICAGLFGADREKPETVTNALKGNPDAMKRHSFSQ